MCGGKETRANSRTGATPVTCPEAPAAFPSQRSHQQCTCQRSEESKQYPGITMETVSTSRALWNGAADHTLRTTAGALLFTLLFPFYNVPWKLPYLTTQRASWLSLEGMFHCHRWIRINLSLTGGHWAYCSSVAIVTTNHFVYIRFYTQARNIYLRISYQKLTDGSKDICITDFHRYCQILFLEVFLIYIAQDGEDPFPFTELFLWWVLLI